MTGVELTATLFGLASVWLYIRQNVWSWPTGLVQVVLYGWVFWQVRLYSDALLHIVYIVLQVYGWHQWAKGRDNAAKLPISRISGRSILLWAVGAAAATCILGTVMYRLTDASLPYWDALIATLSLVATYLLARKVLENWLIWTVVDIVAIGVYLAKGLYITSGLYSVFLVMAIAGWFSWQKSYQMQRTPALSVPAEGSCSESSSPRTAGISS